MLNNIVEKINHEHDGDVCWYNANDTAKRISCGHIVVCTQPVVDWIKNTLPVGIILTEAPLGSRLTNPGWPRACRVNISTSMYVGSCTREAGRPSLGRPKRCVQFCAIYLVNLGTIQFYLYVCARKDCQNRDEPLCSKDRANDREKPRQLRSVTILFD